MKKLKVISRVNLPSSLPTNSTLLLLLMLKVYEATELVYGIVYAVLAFLWIASIAMIYLEKRINIFKNDETT